MVLSLLLTSCADSFKEYFKKSANNKYIDTKGFAGGKRRPVYNKKYINIAKKNVREENFDEEDEEIGEDEQLPASLQNRQIYVDMLKQDNQRKNRQKIDRHRSSAKTGNNDDNYPSLVETNKKLKQQKHIDAEELQKELAQIKSMLNEARKELTKYRCPQYPEAPKNNEDKQHSNKAKVENNNAAKTKEPEKRKLMTIEEDYKKTGSDEPSYRRQHPI